MTADSPAKPRRCPKCNKAVWQGLSGQLIEQGGNPHKCEGNR